VPAEPAQPTLIRYTLWSSIYDIDRAVDVVETWEQLTQRFARHERLASKDRAPGFGPYVLRPPDLPCRRHKDKTKAQRVVRSHAHRCDSCVTGLTLAVFDADIGTEQDVADCDARLAASGLARLWYTTYSHGADGAVAYRLIIPLDGMVQPDAWSQFRQAVIAQYAVPASPLQCGGRSHFYYTPSCPPDATPVTRTGLGTPLRVADYTLPLSVEAPRRPPPVDDYDYPPEPVEPVDLEPLRGELRRQATKLLRSRTESDHRRGGLLVSMLAGKQLAQHGDRNTALWDLTGMLAWRAPGHSVGTYKRLMFESMEAMIAAGTRHTWDDVERMLEGAMEDKHEEDKRNEAIAQDWARDLQALKDAIE
jgi:hypothetical protein